MAEIYKSKLTEIVKEMGSDAARVATVCGRLAAVVGRGCVASPLLGLAQGILTVHFLAGADTLNDLRRDGLINMDADPDACNDLGDDLPQLFTPATSSIGGAIVGVLGALGAYGYEAYKHGNYKYLIIPAITNTAVFLPKWFNDAKERIMKYHQTTPK